MTILDSSRSAVPAAGDQEPSPSPTNSDSDSYSECLELRVQMRDGYAVIAVWGELYAESVDELTRLVDKLTAEGSEHFVLDISRLYDLDTYAIAELIRLQTALTMRQGGLSLAAPRPWVRRLLESMCRNGTFVVHATVAEAIAGERGQPVR